MSKFFKKLFFVLILFSLSLMTGCFRGEPNQPFDEFIDQMFVDMLSGSPLNTNFFLKDPSQYDLEDIEVRPIEISYQIHKQSMWQLRSLRNYLLRYKYENLNPQQKISRDLLLDYVDGLLSYADFYYYETPLGSYRGYNAQLPFILAEYHFYTKKDIENYFAYLTTTKTSFENIINFEYEKAEKGFGMNDYIIDGIIEQCDNFVSEEENFLIGVFNTKIDESDFLTPAEKTSYKSQNQQYVNEDFVGAYRYLSSEMAKLKGKATNSQGLSHFKDGKAYYQNLFREATGSNMSVEDGLSYLETKLDHEFSQMTAYMNQYPNLYDLINGDLIAKQTHQQILNFYLDVYENDFPGIGNVNVQFKPIHESLKENSSPAMYFISPIDADVTEVIYYNDTLFNEDPTYAFITLAHEGVPGHLLQHVHLKNLNIPNLRKLLNYNSYSEGWATYIESYVGKYANVNQDLYDAYQLDRRITYLIFSIADIKINYFSMSLQAFGSYIEEYFGSISFSAIESMYYQLVEEPTNYLEYFFSYYQLIDLKEEFKNKAQNVDVSKLDYEFHKFFLDIGPAPFYILKNQIDPYLSKEFEDNYVNMNYIKRIA